MKARLVQGAVVGGSRQNFPSSLHLCQCYECSNSTCTDPLTGIPVRGCLVTTTILKQHDSLTKARGIASANLAAASIALPTPQFNPPSPPTLSEFLNPIQTRVDTAPAISRASYLPYYQPLERYAPPYDARRKTAQSNSSKRPKSSRTHERQTSRDLAIANTLATIGNLEVTVKTTSRFDKYRDIVFSRGPDARSPPLDANCDGDTDHIWTLKEGVSANSEILAHEHWLFDSLDFVVDAAKTYGIYSTKLRLSCTVLQKHFLHEISVFERDLRSEWERQRWIAIEAAAIHFNMGGCQITILLLIILLTFRCFLSRIHESTIAQSDFVGFIPLRLDLICLLRTFYGPLSLCSGISESHGKNMASHSCIAICTISITDLRWNQRCSICDRYSTTSASGDIVCLVPTVSCLVCIYTRRNLQHGP